MSDSKHAFPLSFPDGDDNYVQYGMSLRDYFAAKAMQSLAADPTVNMVFGEMAEWAYNLADAMMQAREVKRD